MHTFIKNPHAYCWQGKNYFLSFLVILGLISAHPPAYAQQAKKVKIFLMAGQSNMQGHADKDQLTKILCAKDALNLPDDPHGCYKSLTSQEDRLFHTIGDFYGTHPTYDSANARREAQFINQNELVNERLVYPFDRIQAINFNYSRNNGVRNGPTIWSGPLTTGFGHSNNGKSYGSELTFGHYLARFIEDDIVLVKVVEGGTSLHVQWRSPSAEARLGPGTEPSNYPLLVQHINDIKSNISNYIARYQGQNVETEIAGFVWFQGWNDAISSVYAPEYEQNLTDLITDLRNDLALPGLPVVITQTQNDGASGLIVQAAQQAVGNNIGHAASVVTTDLSNYFHFDSGSHLIIGSRMGEKMKELLGLEEVPATVPAAPSGLLAVAQSTNKIQLKWTDNADNEELFRLERSTQADTGFEIIASLSANTNSYLDQGLPHSTTYYYRLSCYNYNGDSPYSNTGVAKTYEPITAVPAEWDSLGVGSPALAGHVRYFDGAFTIEGSGELWVKSDKFYYVYQRFTGDGEIIARLNSMTEPNHWARAGVMIRESLNVDAKYAMAIANSKNRHAVQGRINNADVTFLTGGTDMSFPSWMKLVRSGNLFTGYQSADGITWQQMHQVTIDMADSVYVGLAVSNFNHATTYCKAVFTEVSVHQKNLIPAAPSGLVAAASAATSINLAWVDRSGIADGFTIERSLNGETGFTAIATVAANINFYTSSNLNPGTTYYYRVLAYNNAGTSAYSNVASAQTEGSAPVLLPSPWASMDIGSPPLAGQAGYIDGTFTIDGSGELWGKSDKFHYVFQHITGDVEIIAQLNSMTEPAHWARAGVMIRETLDVNAKYAMAIANPKRRHAVQGRINNTDATFLTGGTDMSFPSWMKLVRSGNLLTGYQSADGITWQQMHQVTIDMADSVYIGLAVSNFNGINTATNNCRAVFSNVSVTRKVPVPGIEEPILFMPRLANDNDKSVKQNTITITTNGDAAGETHPYVGLLGKKITALFGNPVVSAEVTISVKIIPENLTQTADLLEAGNIKITQSADVVSAVIGGQAIANPAKLSRVTCNHIALRLTPHTIDFYVNGTWISVAAGHSANFASMTFGPYNGRLWDIRVFDEFKGDTDIAKLSQYCLPGMAVDNPPNSAYPNPICGAYVCVWSGDTRDLAAANYQGYLAQQEMGYENAVFNAGMHPHGDLETFVNSRRNRDLMDGDGRWADNFTFPLTRPSANYWVHENFHSYQFFHSDAYRKGKWFAEATAEWAPDAIYPGATSNLLGFYTLFPHLPLYRVVGTPVGDYYGQEFIGGSNYGSYVFFSYITNFVSNDSFIGKLYNTESSTSDMEAIDQTLASEGHDLRTVFGDFAARITVWDLEDGTGPYFEDSEQQSLNRMKGAKPEAEVFNAKITDTLTIAGTGGEMVSIPEKMVPAAWAFNAYKVDNTSAGVYRVRLQGLTSNPANTKFQARVIVGADGAYEYFTFPVDSLSAFGMTVTEMNVVTTAGQQLYLVVATTPDNYMGYENHYQYTYSIEAMPHEAGARTDDNTRARSEGVTQAGLEDGDIKVYPNKTDGNLTISLTNDEPVGIRIVNASGMEIPFKAEQNTNMIHVHFDGPAGLYIIRLQTNYYTKNLKILKE